MSDEADLVRRAKQHDKQAFAVLYEENFDRVYRYIYLKSGNRHDAEDITQAVFIKAMEKIHQYKYQGSPFSAWLFRIAFNQLIDLARKNKRRRHEELDPNIPSREDGPQELTERSFDADAVTAATQKLTTSQREVITLRFGGGLSTAEAADMMGKTEGAIKALQHSAVVALRKIMMVSHGEATAI